MGRSPLIDNEQILECMEDLRNNRRVRLIMDKARAADVPYSWALAMWSEPRDIAMEFAMDILAAEESMERCPQCHTRADEIWNERGQPLDGGMWMIDEHSCQLCTNVERANDNKDGLRYRVVPRPPGHPVEPNLRALYRD